ncbi:MAG: menaquinol-cytochrome C reductase [Acidobacteria bacterium]|nr:menaquinol-cytochrome C reductase [Acidobacteriota bacterium]
MKTYGLLGIVRGSTSVADAEPEHEVMAWPHLLMTEFVVLLGVLAGLGVISILFNAPLEELANPSEPPNPAKAPWYFLGLQELVSYSAFVGGVLTPLLVILGLLMAIPYIDRDPKDVGIWFGGTHGKRLAAVTALLTLAGVPSLIFLNAHFGVRRFYPDAPQLIIDLANPASAIVVIIAACSVATGIRARSWRLGAIVVFTGFLIAYTVLTTVGTVFRGPNWGWVWPWEG